ncbi:hypothetical protein [Novosphingobium sp.]|uniref:hypothetical protein n=1 Tax=Novosphingobium sp. TaxID=1874826 RepID=UPI003D0A3EAE
MASQPSYAEIEPSDRIAFHPARGSTASVNQGKTVRFVTLNDLGASAPAPARDLNDNRYEFLSSISEQLAHSKNLLLVIDQRFSDDIAERASQTGDAQFLTDVDVIASLITTTRTQIAATDDMVDAGYVQFAMEPASPSGHVRLQRKKASDDAYAALVQADLKIVERSRPERDAPDTLIDQQTAALKTFVQTRATDIEQVGRKLRTIISEFGDYGLDNCLGHVLADLETLAKTEA